MKAAQQRFEIAVAGLIGGGLEGTLKSRGDPRVSKREIDSNDLTIKRRDVARFRRMFVLHRQP